MTNEQRNHYKGIESSPIKLVASRPVSQMQATTGYDKQLEDDSLYPTRPPSSAMRYTLPNPVPRQNAIVRQPQQGVRKPNQYDTVNIYVRRKSRVQVPQQTPPHPPHPQQQEYEEDESDTKPLRKRQGRHFHWLVFLGCGMVVMLLLWIMGTITLSWWNSYQDDIRYGHPRTYQTDAKVGHNDAATPSHFIALNLNHHAEVIEFPGGDATHAKVYQGPTLLGDGTDSYRVTVSFKDVNGDGKPDMLMNVNGMNYFYINDNGAFRPPNPNEHINAQKG